MLTFVRKLTSLGTVLFAVQQFTLVGHAHAAPCKRLCAPAIQRCAAAGNRRARCKRHLLRLCKASGAAACDGAYPTTTTTTLAPSYVGTWVFSGALDTNDCGATGVDATFTSGLLTLAVSGNTLSGTLADVVLLGRDRGLSADSLGLHPNRGRRLRRTARRKSQCHPGQIRERYDLRRAGRVRRRLRRDVAAPVNIPSSACRPAYPRTRLKRVLEALRAVA